MVRLNSYQFDQRHYIYNSRNSMVRLNGDPYDIEDLIYNSRNSMVRLNEDRVLSYMISTTVEIQWSA